MKWPLYLLVMVAACSSPDASRRTIVTDRAPAAIGPYSQAVEVGNTLYLAGQIGIDPATGQLVTGGIEPETRQVMANISAVLEAAGYTFGDVAQAQVYLADLAEYDPFNALYAGYFPGSPPARAVIEAQRLPRDARVEIMMVAVQGARTELSGQNLKEVNMIHGLRTAIYHVNDLDKAKSWYTKAFDTEPYFDEDFYVGFNIEGFELGLMPAGESGQPGIGGVAAYWGVDDIDATHAHLLKLGAEPHSEITDVGGGIQVASVLDPSGNVLGLIYNPGK